MKTIYFKLLLVLIIFSSCESKVNLSTEIFNKSTYKATIEKAYADSANKTDQDILLTYINYNLDGKIAQFAKESGIVDQVFDLKKDFESPNPPAELTYQNILEKYARPYISWLNKNKEFDAMSTKTVVLKLLKFANDPVMNDKRILQFEVQNNGNLDIVSVQYILSIENKSGEEIYTGTYYTDAKITKGTIAKGTKKIFNINDSEITNVSNMDFDVLKKRIIITEISFQDGTTLKRPEQL
jgi:hypothetical protein